jgi:hypothetical protein
MRLLYLRVEKRDFRADSIDPAITLHVDVDQVSDPEWNLFNESIDGDAEALGDDSQYRGRVNEIGLYLQPQVVLCPALSRKERHACKIALRTRLRVAGHRQHLLDNGITLDDHRDLGQWLLSGTRSEAELSSKESTIRESIQNVTFIACLLGAVSLATALTDPRVPHFKHVIEWPALVALGLYLPFSILLGVISTQINQVFSTLAIFAVVSIGAVRFILDLGGEPSWETKIASVIAIVVVMTSLESFIYSSIALAAQNFITTKYVVDSVVGERMLMASVAAHDHTINDERFRHRFHPDVAQNNRAEPFLAKNTDWFIEQAARSARCLFRRSLRQVHDQHTRASLLSRSDRISATINAHSAMIRQPGLERAAVSRSLLNGAMLIFGGNWRDLAILEGARPVKSLPRRLAPRIALTTAVLGAAYVLPKYQFIIPTVNADQVRTTLVLAALFALVQPDIGKLRETAMSLVQPKR